MQEKGSRVLFQDLHDLLKAFVQQYRNNSDLLKIELGCLRKLETIVNDLNWRLQKEKKSEKEAIGNDLNSLLQTEQEPEKFTLNIYQSIIFCIEAAKPPQQIVTIRKSEGIFGLGASQIEEKTPVALYSAMTRLLNTLDERIKEFKALEKAEKVETPSEIQVFKQQLANLAQRMDLSEQRAYEEGKKAGQAEVIQYIKGNIGRYLNAQQQQQVLLLLDAKSLEATSSSSSTSSAVPVVFATVSDIKDDSQEAKEARACIGNTKFEPIKKLVTFYNSGRASEQEKIVAKWLIFELMLSKYNHTISSIFEGVKIQLSTQCSLNVADLPNLKSLFEAHSQSHDAVTTQVLSAEELAKFHKLTSRTAIYLPQDGTASNCFGSQAARLQGKSAQVVTKEDYVKNAVTKLNGLVKGASMFNQTSTNS